MGLSTTLLGQGLVFGVIAVTYVAFPAAYAAFVAEDNFGEYATAVSNLTAALVFASLFARDGQGRRNYWYLALAAGTFLVGMEEVSWGQRVVGVGTPDFLREINEQSELTVHNVRMLKGFQYESWVGYAMIAYGVLLPTLASLHSDARRALAAVRVPVPPLMLAPIFALSGYLLSSLLGTTHTLRLGREVGEIFFGLAFGLLALECAAAQHSGSYGHVSRWYVPAYLAMVFALALGLTSVRGDPQQLRKRMQGLAGPDELGILERVQAERMYRQLQDRGYVSVAVLEDRGRLMERQNRREEAALAYEQAIAELTNVPRLDALEADKSFALARLYRSVGAEELSNAFVEQSVRKYQADIRTDVRPWEPSNSKRRLALRLSLADVYVFAGVQEAALDVYLGLVDEELQGYDRQRLEDSIGRVLADSDRCEGRKDIEDLRRVPLEEIRRMALAYRAGAVNLCG